ncbi:stress-induced protein [Candidatus Kaiserbacteria bacterium]|nr:stress-induced protein [Candidatus Kaiserbacteria bacterium]
MGKTSKIAPGNSKRGFASMDPEKQRAIARKGGQSVPDEKRSFFMDRDLAARAGRKGGQSIDPAKRSFSKDHALASEAGRKGGYASNGGGKKSSKPKSEKNRCGW